MDKPIEYRDAEGALVASTEPRRDGRHPMEQISDAANEAVRSGKLAEATEQKVPPRTKRGEGVPGVVREEKPRCEQIKDELLVWARDYMAFEVARKPGPGWLYQHQSWRDGRFDHALLRELRRRFGHYDESLQKWVSGHGAD